MNPDMPWLYFVSYAHTRGFGSVQISRSEPITSGAGVAQLNDWSGPDGHCPKCGGAQ